MSINDTNSLSYTRCELCDLADINRGTFYLYYSNIYDMLESIETEFLGKLESIMAESADGGDMLPFLQRLFSFIEENREMCTLLFGRNGDEAFRQRLNLMLREKYRKRAYESKSDMDETEFDYLYGFVVFGLIGIIHCWLERSCAELAQSMAARADGLIMHLL